MKIRVLSISPELLLQFLRHPVAPGITADGIPPDAKITDARWHNGVIQLLVASEEFQEINPVTSEYPVLEVRFHAQDA